MHRLSIYCLLLLLTACQVKVQHPVTDSLIQTSQRQQAIFQQLVQLVPDSLPISDSLSFMILPLQAACPSCRDKSIDSIMLFKDQIPPRHYIILTLRGGMKHIRRYFKNAGYSQIPEIPGVLYLDSLNIAEEFSLYHNNPSFYYTAGGLAYRKIDSRPQTVKEDLQEFFRGYRINHL